MNNMWDGIYSFADQETFGYRIYPKPSVLKRDFLYEFNEIEESRQWPEISIVTLFCGRFQTLASYMWQLANLDYDKKKINLILYCTSKNKYFNSLLKNTVKKIGREYGSLRLVFDNTIEPSPLAYTEKCKEYDLHMDNIPRLYNKAFKLVNTRYFFSFEDDQVNPSHTIKRFLKMIKIKDVASICEVAFDRHNDRNKPVAFDFYIDSRGNNIFGKFVTDRRFCLTPVGSSGFGATIFDNERIMGIEMTQKLSEAPNLTGVDVAFGYQANKYGKVILHDWDVRSYHIDSCGNIV